MSNKHKKIIKAANRNKKELEDGQETRDSRIQELVMSWTQEKSSVLKLENGLGRRKNGGRIITQTLAVRSVLGDFVQPLKERQGKIVSRLELVSTVANIRIEGLRGTCL